MSSVALITSYAPSLVSFRRDLIISLRQRGIKVFALAPNISSQTYSELQQIGATPVLITLERHSFNLIITFYEIFSLSLLLRRLKVNIVLGYFLKPSLIATISALFAGIPKRFFMIEGLGSYFAFSPSPPSLIGIIKRFLIASSLRLSAVFATGIIFLNSEDQQLITGNLPILSRKSFLLGGIGVNLSYWIPARKNDGNISFIYASRLLESKGYRQFAMAALQVKRLYPNTEYYLLGDVDKNSSKKDLETISKLKKIGSICFPGHVNTLEWLQRSSVFVFPSMYREGVPACLQEACACGLPIITSNYPGCNVTVKPSYNGIFIDPFDIDSIAQAMIFFIENPSLIASYGFNSRLIAESNFDSSIQNNLLIDFLQQDPFL